MNPLFRFLPFLLFALCASTGAADLRLRSSGDHQVVQRSTPGKGIIRLVGELTEAPPASAIIEAKLSGLDLDTSWQRAGGSIAGTKLNGAIEAPAGGWWRLDVRVMDGDREIALSSVAHVGIGEVFVAAGQSNSANYGEQKLIPQSGRVASSDGTTWRLADDPQPGAGGSGGSFLPPLGDSLVQALGVPVGFLSCGIEWTEFASLPQCHSLGWVSANVSSRDTKSWDGVLDEVAVVKGVVFMSGHGSGENLFQRPDLRELARELDLALFKFTGNPMQRGFWPQSLLFERLQVYWCKKRVLNLEFSRFFSLARRSLHSSNCPSPFRHGPFFYGQRLPEA